MNTELEMTAIDLSDHDRSEVVRILTQCVPAYTVWAFGSRVYGTAKAYSDLDVAILADKPLSLELIATLNDAFSESDLTIRVDVVDWSTASDLFRNIIKQNYLLIQTGIHSG